MKKQNVRHDSITSKILTVLYPDKQLTCQQICDNLPTNNDSVKRTIRLMLKPNIGYIKTSERNPSRNRVYFLTQQGRWFAISSILNVSFLSLCMLSDIYVVQRTMNETGKNGFYPVVRMMELIENATNKRSMYSKRYLQKNLRQLTNQNIVKRLQKNIVSIHPHVFTLLQNYDHDLTNIQRWFYSTIDGLGVMEKRAEIQARFQNEHEFPPLIFA